MENEKTITIHEIPVTLYKWNLRKVMHNQNIIVPLIKDPLINGMAFAESGDEDTLILSVIEGVLTSLEGLDFEKLAEKLLDGVYYRDISKSAQLQPVTIEKLEESGFGLSDVMAICVAVIKFNYGDFLKKDLLDSLMKIISD